MSRSLAVPVYLSTCWKSCLQSVDSTLLLLLGRDVETNPGPATKAQEEVLSDVLTVIQKLETGQGAYPGWN